MTKKINNLLINAKTKAHVRATELATAKEDGISDIVIAVGLLAIGTVMLVLFNGGVNNTIKPTMNSLFEFIGGIYGGLTS